MYGSVEDAEAKPDLLVEQNDEEEGRGMSRDPACTDL
jgi:hypothetical protein